MNFSGYRYYKLNYEILKFLRLWNTEPKAPEVLLRLVLLYSFLMGSVVQVAALCMNEYSVTEMCRIVIFIHCSYSFFNKYLMLYVHIKKVKFLFARVEQDWNRLDNMDEYNILKRYTESSKLVRTIFILPGSVVTVMYGYAPIVLDLLMPLNESRPRRFLFAVEFFVIDPIEHFMSINTILIIIIFLGVATMTIIDGSVVMFIMHNCAMFKIAGHRLQRAINAKETLSVRTKLVEATMIHQGAIEFADVQREIYSISYFGFLVLGSTSITMTLYTLSNAVLVTQATRDLTEAVYFLIFQFSYLFLCNYASQLLINHSSNVFGIIDVVTPSSYDDSSRQKLSARVRSAAERQDSGLVRSGISQIPLHPSSKICANSRWTDMYKLGPMEIIDTDYSDTVFTDNISPTPDLTDNSFGR